MKDGLIFFPFRGFDLPELVLYPSKMAFFNLRARELCAVDRCSHALIDTATSEDSLTISIKLLEHNTEFDQPVMKQSIYRSADGKLVGFSINRWCSEHKVVVHRRVSAELLVYDAYELEAVFAYELTGRDYKILIGDRGDGQEA